MAVRDVAYQAEVLRNLGREVERRAGENATGFISLIDRRISAGAAQYGDTAFLSPERDNAHEATMELADYIAYLLFEMMKVNACQESPPENVHHLLFENMVGAAVLYFRTRYVARLLAGKE